MISKLSLKPEPVGNFPSGSYHKFLQLFDKLFTTGLFFIARISLPDHQASCKLIEGEGSGASRIVDVSSDRTYHMSIKIKSIIVDIAISIYPITIHKYLANHMIYRLVHTPNHRAWLFQFQKLSSFTHVEHRTSVIPLQSTNHSCIFR